MTPAAGIRLLRKTKLSLFESRTFYKTLILILTFFAYSAFHISRRPLSIVKSVLNKNCSTVVVPPGIHVTNETRDEWCDWERESQNLTYVTSVVVVVLPEILPKSEVS